MYLYFVKPFFDRLIAFIALIVLSPLFLVLAIWLAIFQQGSIFFLQERPGRKGQLFKVIKFRTMGATTDDHGHLLPGSQRLTRIGSFFRRTSLDELPQLWNVLKGEMSIVGPRPLLISYLPLFSEEQQRRHSVLPGITGWTQVNGRHGISWNEKLALDIYYVRHVSLWLDLIILFKTVILIFSFKKDISLLEKPFTGN